MSKRSHIFNSHSTRSKLLRTEMPKVIDAEDEMLLSGRNFCHEHFTKTEKVTLLESPLKSENDKKNYRIIRLENGLTAIIISDVIPEDEKTLAFSEHGSSEESEDDSSDDSSCSDTESRSSSKKLAAASLCVGVGSFSDPVNFPGLAHFLEHMVFMGSKKYPKENDFDSFIKKRGGSNNAYTEWNSTTFYFESRQEYLEESLDRFAQFFVDPLMHRESISREREAVESEFQMSLPSDTHRKQQLFCCLARKEHPVCKFPWGDKRTLSPKGGTPQGDDILREQLFLFHKRHYSAHRMTLAIQGRLPLDELQEMVCKSFSCVPSNHIPPDVVPPKGDWSSPFLREEFNRIYNVVPIKDICQVELHWILPPKTEQYKTKPHEYISWLVGHEGKGSLLSYLRQRVWALDIYTGVGSDSFDDNILFCVFGVTIILTESGFTHLKEVLDATFAYLNMLKNECPNERIYEEIERIENTAFKFLEEQSAVDNVEEISENLQSFAPRDVLAGSTLFYDYSPQDIKEVVNLLKPETVNVMVCSKTFTDGNQSYLTEKWFGTQYLVEDIPAEWLNGWNSGFCGDFHLPEPNIFLPSDFELLPSLDAPKSPHPVCIACSNALELWVKQDFKFRLPHMHCYFQLISPGSQSTPQASAMLGLFLGLLKMQLVEEAYVAEVAGLSYDIHPSNKGIIFKVNGFNHKLPFLLERILHYMINFRSNLNEVMYDALKRKQQQIYYNSFLQPKKLSKDLYFSLLLETNWNSVEKHAAISQVTPTLLVEYVENILLKRLYVQALIQGNVTEEQALQIGSRVISFLNSKPIITQPIPQVRVCQLPLGEYYCRVKSFNDDDKNITVTNYYQSGRITMKSSCVVELIMMLMEEPLFDELRTKQQLGYSVSCCIRDTFGVLGFTVTVSTQADKFSVHDVDKRIEIFLQDFVKLLMSPEGAREFEVVCQALIKIKQCVDNQLEEEVTRNWSEITSSDYVFDRLQLEVKCLRDISIQDVRDWLADHIVPEKRNNFRKLSIQVVSALEDELEKGNPMPQLMNLKELARQRLNLINQESECLKDAESGYCQGEYSMHFLGGPQLSGSPTKRKSMSDVITHCNSCKAEGREGIKCNSKESHFIMSIEGFKNELYMYPITRIDLDN